ncbi:MAG: hypothetical protein ACM3TR_18775 [Caulobacteraceae bacterium]
MSIKLKFSVIGFLFLFFIAATFSLSNHYTFADQKYIELAGNYVKTNSELLSKSINTVEDKIANNEDVVTNVNLLPITIQEIEFRKGLRQVAGDVDVSDKAVFNTLIEEKLIISYAIKYNILPSKREIDDFIASERVSYDKEATTKKLIDDFCAAANMSIEDYWKTYEYYNAYRIVTFKRAYDYAIEAGINKGELKALKNNNPMDTQTVSEHEGYWKKIKKELKDKTSLEINKQYQNRGFNIDKSKLYL